LIQNLNLALIPERRFFISTGIGIAPVYVLASKSVFGNSIAHLGALALVKFDFTFLTKNPIEYVITLKSAWGSAGGTEMFLSNLGLGLNFE